MALQLPDLETVIHCLLFWRRWRCLNVPFLKNRYMWRSEDEQHLIEALNDQPCCVLISQEQSQRHNTAVNRGVQ